MQKKEAKCNTLFNHWLKNVYKQTGAYELKQCEISLPYSAVVPHQIEALQQVSDGTFVWKIPDCGFQNPFDVFSMTKIPAYVVIFFPKNFYLITINNFIFYRDNSKRKSITEKECLNICHLCVNLKG